MTHRTWFIAGVNSGFGRHVTEHLLARGDRVAGTVRKMDAMNDLKGKYGDKSRLALVDVYVPEFILKLRHCPAVQRAADARLRDSPFIARPRRSVEDASIPW